MTEAEIQAKRSRIKNEQKNFTVIIAQTAGHFAIVKLNEYTWKIDCLYAIVYILKNCIQDTSIRAYNASLRAGI